MQYTLHQLQVFLKVTQTLSITKAAEELHLTQPAVSIQLKNFQDQFEIPLTEIIGRKLYVTEFGHEIAQAAEKILQEVYAINYKTLAYKGFLSGKLTISIVSTGKYIMPYILSDFFKKHPGIELNLDVSNKVKVLEKLERNETDLALVSILPESIQTEKLELMENKLFLVGNKDYSLSTKPKSPNYLEELALIYRELGSGTRQSMEQFFQKNQLFVRKKLELTSNEAVKQAILAGLGCSIMPLIGIKNELMNGDLTILPVKGLPIKTSWNLIWLKGKKHSYVAQAFLNHLKENKTQIVNEHFNWTKAY